LDRGGELIKLDWERKEILAKVPIVARGPAITDPNPRGGTRGGRGILVTSEEVYVASYHTFHVFDRDLNPIRSFSNHLFADLHELAWQNGAIWAASTVLDAAIMVDPWGKTLESWWPREDPIIAGRYDLPPLALDKEKDNRLSYLGTSHVQRGHTHLNTVALLDDRPLVLLNQFGCVVRLNPTEILLEDPRLRGAHNLLVTPDRRIVINDTANQAVVIYDSSGRLCKRIQLARFWPVRKIRWRFALRGMRIWLGARSPSFRLGWFLMGNIVASRPVFVRGLSLTPFGTLLVGVSPATILEIDWKTDKLVRSFTYSKNVNEAVHGLVCA
jgi:hypothetical protein